jgi:hypothetical protein
LYCYWRYSQRLVLKFQQVMLVLRFTY